MELLGGLAATMAGVPWLFAERSSVGAYPPTVKNYLRVQAARFASAIVSNSTGGDLYWRDRQPHTKRYVIGNALPLDEIRAAVVAGRHEFHAAHDEVCVLFAGRLDSGKNAALLIAALGQVRSARPVRVLLCGEGPLRSDLESQVRERGLDAQVRFAGYVQNLWGLLKRADVLVSPSRFEGNPNVVLEAMACGCPLVISDIPAHREILDDESALFAGADDASALALRIEDVINRPDAAAQRARAAQARADQCGLPQIASQYLNVYREVVAHRGRRSLRVA
jgi:glycosyltransferase involved in cell wall biosynthesis